MQMSVKNFRNGLLLLLMATLFAYCGKKTDTPEQQAEAAEPEENWTYHSPEDALPLSQRVRLLLDSTLYYQRAAFRSEQTKLDGATSIYEGLLKRYGKTPYPKALSEAGNYLQRSRELLYDESSLADETRMEAYDQAISGLLSTLQSFANKDIFDEVPYARVHLKEAKDADQADFLLRKRYNDYASSLNNLLKTNAREIKALGAGLDTLKAFPLFYGQDPYIQ